jgi:glycosyltransferase involved in cell wall biosynthesis
MNSEPQRGPPLLRVTIATGFFLPVPAAGGGATEKIWHGLARIFASSGYSVNFVSRTWPGQASRETVDGIHHIRVPGFDHTRFLPVNLLLDLIWGIRVARVLPPGDVVICNTVTLPVWLHRFRPSVGRVAVMIGRSPKGQVPFYRGVARIYAPSSSVARRISQRWASERTRVTGYPINWPLLAGSATQTGSPVIVGFVGRLHPEKGLELLVRAARVLSSRSDLPDWRLRIIGPASVGAGGGGEAWAKNLRKEAAEALGGRVEWRGPEFDPGRLAVLYGAIDIFCYPSLAEKGETFGVAVAEAMAARGAAVVSALECFNDLVTDGETGLVFDHAAPGAEERLAACIARLIADPALRGGLAARGQQHVRRFDYSEVSRKILDDLSLLARAGTEKSR